MHARKDTFSCISRLTTQAAFDCLRKSGTRWVAQSLVLQVVPRADAATYGLCVSASKRTAAKAVDRNRMRRRLRAAALNVLPNTAKPGLDYMVTARAAALTRDMKALEEDLRWCLKKLELARPA